MAYETKVILQALADIACRVDTAEDVYKSIQRMAGVEGLVLKPYEEAKKELAWLTKEGHDNGYTI